LTDIVKPKRPSGDSPDIMRPDISRLRTLQPSQPSGAAGVSGGTVAIGQLFQIWKLEIWPAGQPVFAVKFSRKYRPVAVMGMVTLLLLLGSKV
jgi:hypothetical protein